MTDDIPELTPEDFAHALLGTTRERFLRGEFRDGEDVRALRRFTWLSQAEFAAAMGISVHTLRNWEQDRRRPDGPSCALLRIAARSPTSLRKNLPNWRLHSRRRLASPLSRAGTVSEGAVGESPLPVPRQAGTPIRTPRWSGSVRRLRRSLGMTQAAFAAALGIRVRTLRNWEQRRRSPGGPALALIRIAARRPELVLWSLAPPPRR